MRISRILTTLAAVLLAPALAVAATVKFESAREALKQGMSAYSGGYYEIAIPALEHAAAENEVMAEYYLARIYSDNAGAHTNHAKAYLLFQKIADEYAEIDPDIDPRAEIVGKSLTALARYMISGLPEIGLRQDPARAAEYLHNASTTFDDEDAQFELAKMQLKGEGVEQNVALARHFLSVLSQQGHPGAQAFLADLLWRGMYTDRKPVRALALITVAVHNATPQDRLWIEDIYQQIYCGAGAGVRRQATGVVADWGKRFGRQPDLRDSAGLGEAIVQPPRMCPDGEVIAPYGSAGEAGTAAPPTAEAGTTTSGRDAFTFGSSGSLAAPGPDLRDVGSSFRDEAR